MDGTPSPKLFWIKDLSLLPEKINLSQTTAMNLRWNSATLLIQEKPMIYRTAAHLAKPTQLSIRNYPSLQELIR
jgi:hypothetical protein